MKMKIESKNNQMLKLNKYAREYIDNYNSELDYQKIAKQMRDFSEAEYVIFNIFDENGKDFTLVGFEGDKKNIDKAMDIIGYNVIGKKFKYEKGRNEKFEKSVVTKVKSLRELVGNALPATIIKVIEKIFKIDNILTVRITKNEKTIGNFTLMFSENKNKNNDKILELFASQVGLYIDKKSSGQNSIKSIQRFKSLLKNSVSIITIVDNEGNYIDVSDSTADLLGIKKEDLIGKSFKEIVPEEAEDIMNMLSTINKTKEPIHKEEIYHVNNEERLYERIIFPIEEKDNEVVLFGSIANDITEKVRYEEKIRNERDYIYKIFNSMKQYVVVTGLDYKIQFMNKKAIEELGNIKGKICYNELGEGKPCDGCRLHEIENLEDNESIKYETNIFNKDLEINASKLKNLDGSLSIVEVIDDITEKKERQREIEYLNFHDHLTGLFNRRFFEEELKKLDLDRNLPLSIITVDINGLKLINDTFGRQKGDEILIKSANIIKKSIRTDDIAARIGGDEFLVILPKCREKEAFVIAGRLKENIKSKSEEGIPFSLAIGTHTKTKSKEDIADILKKAESKMYTNKIFSEQSKKREVILTMLSTLHEKHTREEEHSIRVGQLSYNLGKAIKIKGDRLNTLKTAGLLHDIGKIAIDYSIIEKAGRLTEEEYKEIKKHPEIGYRILKTSIEYEDIAKLVLYHHEKIDGSGYPKGIKESEIPLESKIISIVDSFDAMISSRPYKRKMTIKEAVYELKRCSGTQFDSDLVEVFSNQVIKKNMYNI